MNQNGERQKKDDTLVFASEAPLGNPSLNADLPNKFKLLIIDDEKEIHVMTKLVLSDYSFKNTTLQFFSAYSAKEAKTLIREHPDAACVLLDVVMEDKDSGLKVARFIREDEKNDKIRIILRTGQPGKAPENDIILNYDINDYKEKTELTSQKLFTTITTALRSYNHLLDLEKKNALIAEKNNQLNDEVARRIVAESNLTKYNRSLEKMIDDKSSRLKTAIQALRKKEKELKMANHLAQVGDISSKTMTSIDISSEHLKKNLNMMNIYQSDMAILLEKYETLQQIICAHADKTDTLHPQTQMTMDDIEQFKKNVHIEDILKKYPEIIKDSTNGISAISKTVSDIKLFISINNEPLIDNDLNPLIQKTLNQIKNRFSSSIELQISFKPLPVLLIAKKSMEKAFYEVLKNAFEAVESRGIISVSTVFNVPFIEIHISDVGTGIDPEHLNKVFTPYFTTHTNGAKGLGLSFAKSVITNHNGTIDIDSVKSEGTHVLIKLPVPEPTE